MPEPIMPPVDFSTVQVYDDAASLAAYHEKPTAGLRYSRDGSSTLRELERLLNAYEPGYRSLAFSSGMAAIAALLDTFRGEQIWLPKEKYRKLEALKEHHLFREYEFLDSVPREGVLWVEAPSNPHLRTPQYSLLQRMKQDMTVVGDVSFAGLGNVKYPHLLYDYMVHSATKYINGHNDAVGGVVFALDSEGWHKLWQRRSYGGGVMDPMTAYLTYRGLKTYRLRMERQVRNAAMVVNYLTSKTVPFFYPEDGRNLDRPSKYYEWHHHGAAVVSFLSNHPPDRLTDIAGAVHTAKMGASFGGVDSLVEVPATMSRLPVEPNLVRYSVGIEPVDLILDDIRRLIG